MIPYRSALRNSDPGLTFPRDTDPIQIYAVGAKRTLDPIACVIKIIQTLILDPHPHARPWCYEPPSPVGPAGERPRPACPVARRRSTHYPAPTRRRRLGGPHLNPRPTISFHQPF